MAEFKYTKEDLDELQSLSIEEKVALSLTRIIEWYEKYDGKVYVSFSGGKDSTVLLHLVRSIYPDVPAVFIDTGLEFPEIKEFVKTFDNVVYLRPKMTFKEVIEKYGYPIISKGISSDIHIARHNPDGKTMQKFVEGSDYHKKYGDSWMLTRYKYLLDAPFETSRQCCYTMKKNTAHAYDKSSGRMPIIGTMANEAEMRKLNWMRFGCNAFDIKNPSSTPLAFWTEQDIFTYIVKNKIPIASVYGNIIQNKNGEYKTTGWDRTGCIFCGFGIIREKEPNRFQRLKQTHPQLWEYCMKPTDRGGLGMGEVLEYIGVKTE